MIIPLDIFLSHADEDKKIARQLANELEVYNFRVFVAHDDIVVGQEWESMLSDKIQEYDILLALLSKNFHIANYTDHEVGIAYALKKPILPVRIDETMPYGFMSKYQAAKISIPIDSREIESLKDKMLTFSEPHKRTIDDMIDLFESSDSFDEANTLSQDLFSYDIFSEEQCNRIASTYLNNNQIADAWTAADLCKEFFSKNWKKLSKENQARLGGHLQQ